MKFTQLACMLAGASAWTTALPTLRPIRASPPRLSAAGEKYTVFLMDDGFNMREYVERVLMMVCYLSQTEAHSLMTQADWNYSARIGTWEQPVAEHVLKGLRKAGLRAAIQPVDDDNTGPLDDGMMAARW